MNPQSQIRNTSKFDNKINSHNSATIAECLQEDILKITIFTSNLTEKYILGKNAISLQT